MAGAPMLSVPAAPFSLLILAYTSLGLIATLIPARRVLPARSVLLRQRVKSPGTVAAT